MRGALALFVVVAVAVAAFALRPSDPRMSADEAERALARFVAGAPFQCTREENDGSISLEDVDYVCVPTSGGGPFYWIGTEREKISEYQQSGP